MTLILPCVITVVVETVLFRIFGFKKAEDLVIIVLSNIITNLTLNVLILLVPGLYDIPWLIIAELIVVAIEYLIYRNAFEASAGLLPLTFAANALSFFAGLLLETIGVF